MTDFERLPILKMGLKEKCSATMQDNKFNVTAQLRNIPKETFCRYFKQWHY
jgi:hypothetical protein